MFGTNKSSLFILGMLLAKGFKLTHNLKEFVVHSNFHTVPKPLCRTPYIFRSLHVCADYVWMLQAAGATQSRQVASAICSSCQKQTRLHLLTVHFLTWHLSSFPSGFSIKKKNCHTSTYYSCQQEQHSRKATAETTNKRVTTLTASLVLLDHINGWHNNFCHVIFSASTFNSQDELHLK